MRYIYELLTASTSVKNLVLVYGEVRSADEDGPRTHGREVIQPRAQGRPSRGVRRCRHAHDAPDRARRQQRQQRRDRRLHDVRGRVEGARRGREGGV